MRSQIGPILVISTRGAGTSENYRKRSIFLNNEGIDNENECYMGTSVH